MKNFLKIADGVDVKSLLIDIQRQPELWNKDTIRTEHELSPHRNVDDIILWFNRPEKDNSEVINDIQTHPTEAWAKLPRVRPIVFDLIRRVEGSQLGRCVITKLKPGGKIDPHVDLGAPATFYQRFHVALNSAPGCNFIIEDEQVNFKSGEVWMINNNAEHSVVNNSKEDRIVIIIDVRCA